MVSFKSPVNSRIIKNCSTVIDFVLSDKQTKILKLARNLISKQYLVIQF